MTLEGSLSGTAQLLASLPQRKRPSTGISGPLHLRLSPLVISHGSFLRYSAMNQRMGSSLPRLVPLVVTMDTLPSLAMWAGALPGTSMACSFQKSMWSGGKPTHLWWRVGMTSSLLPATIPSTSLMTPRGGMNTSRRQSDADSKCLPGSSRPGLGALSHQPPADSASGRRTSRNQPISSHPLGPTKDP